MKGSGVCSVTECTFFNQDVLNIYSVSTKFKFVYQINLFM
jgi:hypothetical protein